ncbi:MAG TPA: MscL family protein [Candidatus Woesebacteria bacterium]|nr:MscL family protein [Candidatus Woesebacteria bacterium]
MTKKLSKPTSKTMIKKPALDFLDFIREQGVVGLAIGFILGGSIRSVVDSIVNDLINPLLGLLLGKVNFSQAVWQIGSAQIAWGNFIATLINFTIVAAVVFFGVKGLGLEKLDKKKK